MSAGTFVESEIRSTQERLFETGRRIWGNALPLNRRVKARKLARWVAHSVPTNNDEATRFGWPELAGECGLARDDFCRESVALVHAATAAAVAARYGSTEKLTRRVTGALSASARGRWRRSRRALAGRMARVERYWSAFDTDDPVGAYAVIGYRFADFCEASTTGLCEAARDALALAGVDIYVSTYVVTMLTLDPFHVITR